MLDLAGSVISGLKVRKVLLNEINFRPHPSLAHKESGMVSGTSNTNFVYAGAIALEACSAVLIGIVRGGYGCKEKDVTVLGLGLSREVSLYLLPFDCIQDCRPNLHVTLHFPKYDRNNG